MSKEKQIKIHLNDSIKVKLTDYAKNIYYHRFDHINEKYGRVMINPHYPKEDEEGYTLFQLYQFINLYGGLIDVVERNILKTPEIFYLQKKG